MNTDRYLLGQIRDMTTEYDDMATEYDDMATEYRGGAADTTEYDAHPSLNFDDMLGDDGQYGGGYDHKAQDEDEYYEEDVTDERGYNYQADATDEDYNYADDVTEMDNYDQNENIFTEMPSEYQTGGGQMSAATRAWNQQYGL